MLVGADRLSICGMSIGVRREEGGRDEGPGADDRMAQNRSVLL